MRVKSFRPPPTVRVTTLPNGLRVATDTMPGVETATVGVWTSCGARNETEAENGVAHLLEHMLFKGTARRSAQAIAEEIEAVGGQMNAYTARENTAYYARVLKEDVALAVDVIGDLLQHSVFDETELARERSVVLQEIGQANDTPDDIIFDHFQAAAYPGQSIGRPVLGTPDTVAGMSRSALTGYLGAHYAPSELVLTAAGALDHDRLVDQAIKVFDALPANGPPPLAAVALYRRRFPRGSGSGAAPFPARVSRSCDRRRRLLHPIGAFDPAWRWHVFAVVPGGARKTRPGLRDLYVFLGLPRRRGLRRLCRHRARPRSPSLVPVVCNELCAIAGGVGEAELNRARAQLKSGLLMSLESTMSRAEQLGQHLLVFGRPIPTQEIISRIDGVDADAVRHAAAKLFSQQPTVAALGPVAQLESIERIAARLR